MKKIIILFAMTLIVTQTHGRFVTASTPPLPDSYLLTKTTFDPSTFPVGVSIQNDSLTGPMLINKSGTPLYIVRALGKDEGIGGIPTEYSKVIKLVSNQIFWQCTYNIKLNTDAGCMLLSGKGLSISEEDFSLYQFQRGPVQTRGYVKPENLIAPPPQAMYIHAFYGGKMTTINGSVNYSVNEAFTENPNLAHSDPTHSDPTETITSTQMGILSVAVIILVLVTIFLVLRKFFKRKPKMKE